MEKLIWLCVDDVGLPINAYDSVEVAKQAWKLGYSKLFVPTFEPDENKRANRLSVFSATGNKLGGIVGLIVFTKAEHL